jgi:hypothetical protein
MFFVQYLQFMSIVRIVLRYLRTGGGERFFEFHLEHKLCPPL